jgi:ABC-type glutathione transport system ATPase component
MPEPLLEVQGLAVDLISEHHTPRAILSDVGFSIDKGSILGLFGESGCGKTTLALALLSLLPAGYRVSGSVRLQGRELLGLSERELQGVRGSSISMVFQDPMLALNPVMRVRDQVAEVLRAHRVRAEIEPLFELAGLQASRRLLNSYPHQLSGGERQRVTIAQALACRPALVIADEPFTALDGPRVLELIALFRGLKERTGASFLLISHSLGVLASVADRVLVMREGRVVEQGPTLRVFDTPSNPYTADLLHAIPRISRPAEDSPHGQ